jgi:hypothetical protein
MIQNKEAHMSGGRIQGDVPPKAHEAPDEVIKKADHEMESALREHRGREQAEVPHNLTDHGPPSPDHERPKSPKGERDPVAAKSGHRAFIKHDHDKKE